MVCFRVVFLSFDGFTSQDWESLGVAVVEDFDNFGFFIALGEVAFIYEEGAAEDIEGSDFFLGAIVRFHSL